MYFAIWSLIIGALLLTMALAGTLAAAASVSTAMLYLAAASGSGPPDWRSWRPIRSFTTVIARTSVRGWRCSSRCFAESPQLDSRFRTGAGAAGAAGDRFDDDDGGDDRSQSAWRELGLSLARRSCVGARFSRPTDPVLGLRRPGGRSQMIAIAMRLQPHWARAP